MKCGKKLYALVVFMLVSSGPAQAQEPLGQVDDPVAITEVFSQTLPRLSYHKASTITVEYAPGGESSAHRHDVAVFAYVLQGRVESQLKGEAPRTFRKGDMWYEAPGTVHLVSRNASKTHPAKLLVFFVQEQGKAPTVAIESTTRAR